MCQAVVSIDDAAIILGVNRKSAFKAANAGDLPTVRVGALKKVPSAKLRTMLGLTATPSGTEAAA